MGAGLAKTILSLVLVAQVNVAAAAQVELCAQLGETKWLLPRTTKKVSIGWTTRSRRDSAHPCIAPAVRFLAERPAERAAPCPPYNDGEVPAPLSAIPGSTPFARFNRFLPVAALCIDEWPAVAPGDAAGPLWPQPTARRCARPWWRERGGPLPIVGVDHGGEPRLAPIRRGGPQQRRSGRSRGGRAAPRELHASSTRAASVGGRRRAPRESLIYMRSAAPATRTADGRRPRDRRGVGV